MNRPVLTAKQMAAIDAQESYLAVTEFYSKRREDGSHVITGVAAARVVTKNARKASDRVVPCSMEDA